MGLIEKTSCLISGMKVKSEGCRMRTLHRNMLLLWPNISEGEKPQPKEKPDKGVRSKNTYGGSSIEEQMPFNPV